MKKTVLITLFILGAICLKAQTTATLKNSSRLFATKDDLTSVILIIPADSVVTVLDADSTYLHVVFEENEGYIFNKKVVLNKIPLKTQQSSVSKEQATEPQQAQEQEQSRFSYLENKYGTSMAARLTAGKIWKGMNSEMVKDSWGTAEKINRVISGNIVKEEWIFRNTWLYFENNTLVEWGPVKN
jgi:hypothetical protein